MAIEDITNKQELQGFIEQVLPDRQSIGAWQALPALQNGWTATAAPTDPQYRIDTRGVVEFRGEISPGTTTDGTLIWTMPVGFRPVAECMLLCVHGGTSLGSSWVKIQVDGAVTCWFGASGNPRMNLAPIRYPTY